MEICIWYVLMYVLLHFKASLDYQGPEEWAADQCFGRDGENLFKKQKSSSFRLPFLFLFPTYFSFFAFLFQMPKNLE